MIDYSTCKKNRYIYAWYYTNTNEIFYIGKGTGGRWKDTVGSRNNLFKSIINKHLSKGEVAVKKLYENLTEEESLSLERKLIREYWDKGLCKANFMKVVVEDIQVIMIIRKDQEKLVKQ